MCHIMSKNSSSHNDLNDIKYSGTPPSVFKLISSIDILSISWDAVCISCDAVLPSVEDHKTSLMID